MKKRIACFVCIMCMALMVAAQPSRIVLKNGKVVDSESMSVAKADVLIVDGVIALVGDAGACKADTVIDCTGKIVTAGFVDSHVHIESSMVLPKTFGEVVLLHGTTTVIADPHEVVNVAGAEGLSMFLNETDKAPISIFTVIPSCVPATRLETNGAGHFTAEKMSPFVNDRRVVGLGEVMSFVDVANGEQEMMDKLELFKGRPIDGHTAGMDDALLDAYVSKGISNDHECYDAAGLLKRYAKGMNIYIREGSAARNADALLQCVKDYGLDVARFAFCTDDKHLSTIEKEGHISHIVRKALAMGFSWPEVARMASLNACRYYGLANRGNIRKGYVADIVVTDEACSKIACVLKGGKTSYRLIRNDSTGVAGFPNTVVFANLTADEFMLEGNARENAISIVPGQLLTKRVAISEDKLKECNVLATIERHGKNGNMAVCPLIGYGIKNGAVATSVAHDSHNVICAGDNGTDMAAACNRLREIGGGYVIASGGKVVDEFPLPCCGLMSEVASAEAIEGIARMERKAHELGVSNQIDPFITLSFLALPVIPDIRLLDTGLFDVLKSEFITSGLNNR